MNAVTKACKAQKTQTAKAYETQKVQATIATKLANSHETQIALLNSQNGQIEPLSPHKPQAKSLNSHSLQGKQQEKLLNSHSLQGEQEIKLLNSREILNLHNAQTKPSNSRDLQKPNSHEFTAFSNPQAVPNILPQALQTSQSLNKAPSKRQDILYHNDFNAEIFFPANFNELDFNIFYTIFYFLKERKDELVKLKFQEIKDLIYEGRKQKEKFA